MTALEMRDQDDSLRMLEEQNERLTETHKIAQESGKPSVDFQKRWAHTS